MDIDMDEDLDAADLEDGDANTNGKTDHQDNTKEINSKQVEEEEKVSI
jgi:hypothetical protein